MIADSMRIEAVVRGGEADPFSLLGMHRTNNGLVVRAFRPRADRLEVIDADDQRVVRALERVDERGFFSGDLYRSKPFAYRLRERAGERVTEFADPYSFGYILGDADAWLIAEGEHHRLWQVLGSHVRTIGGVLGVAFAVWAPNAHRVSVVGDFNDWDGRVHVMRFRSECGVWEIFIPGELAGERYKYEIAGPTGALLPLRADPFAVQSELRPLTASIVSAPSAHTWTDDEWMERRAETSDRGAPIAIYECHLGSWRRKGEDGREMLTYRELAETLVPYVRELGYTHLELLPISEHPYDGSWGYQTTGMYAPTSRFGTPDDFRAFVDAAHAAGVGVILDWVPGHFPTDAHGLGEFDGTHLYEHMDPRKGFHREWGTYVYNHGRREVRNFLISSALYWLHEYHIDGLRVDAVSSIVYLDYDRHPGEWIANEDGSNENRDATAFLRKLNETVYAEFPSIMTVAEESTAWPKVSWPTYLGGLGFGYKWNMGWMHDTLRLFSRDPLYRGFHLGELSFSLMYAFSENYILPFSHDEVVHLKRSLLGRMPGYDDSRFASLRALYALMYAHPGKKLMFMGAEFAQEGEWNEGRSLDWHLLADARRRGTSRLVRDLNTLYRATPALYRCDYQWEGFQWIDCSDRSSAVVAFIRRDPADESFVVVVLNLSGIAYERYRIGVPQAGAYREIFNTDAALYGGGNLGNLGRVEAAAPGAHGFEQALELVLPAQSVVMFAPA